jgi:hypothetical protein
MRRFGLIFALVALAGPLLFSWPANAQTPGARKNQDAANSIQAQTSLTVSFANPVATGDTVVVMVAYSKSSNFGQLQVAGLGSTNGLQNTCTPGYAPPFTNKVGIAFFYCANVQNSAADPKDLKITAPNKDNLVVLAQEWQNLSIFEDPGVGQRGFTSGRSTTPSGASTTGFPNDVIFSALVYKGGALPSPPQPATQPAVGYTDSFRAMPTNTNLYAPSLIGSYYITSATGSYVDNWVLNKKKKWLTATVALQATNTPLPLFTATPLTDCVGDGKDCYTPALPTPGTQSFAGLLYDGSNDLATASPQHHNDGLDIANNVIQPLDRNGNPAKKGKIGVLVIGMSNWTEENCTGNPAQLPKCDPNTFFDQLKKSHNLNPKVVLADCAQGAAFAPDWMSTTSADSAWPNCIGPSPGANLLSTVYHLNPNQVQVVLWKDADDAAFQAQPPQPPLWGMNIMTSPTCPPNTTNDLTYNQTAPDACVYEWEVANVARTVKSLFPNAKLMFLHARIYGGYTDSRSPHYEPYTYEYGFGTKWLIQAQIDQASSGTPDQLAGDLCYQAPCLGGENPVVPWLAWGPYFWANPPSGPRRADGLQWYAGDLTFDGIHGSWCRFYGIECGRKKVADQMMSFYTSSPYSIPWLLKTGAAP